ncbi:MAG: choice-of-anchor J domain-containing protein [Paludibacteraceae bacterium]|nr:choice-of-anchor J domain-containing protein [Paludibacteraceae bacterium]
MKKLLIFILSSVMIALTFSSCDYNEENFSGLDEMTTYQEAVNYEYTISESDFTTIISALRANKNAQDSATANLLSSSKIFSAAAPASTLVPYVLKSKFIGATNGSAAKVTYQYKTGSYQYYLLTQADYKTIWQQDFIYSLTPSKSPQSVLPGFLSQKFATAKEGDIKILEYLYATTDPITTEDTIEYFLENFESYEAGSGKIVPVSADNSFILNKDFLGTRTWECRTFSNNKYAQVTSNASNSENQVWLITKQIDLTNANVPSLTFDVNVGYYNADCLSILISDNFDGTEAGVATATWTDVTSSFTIPQTPTSGYGTLTSAGTLKLSAFNGKKIYVAFKYTGDGRADANPKKTTTYQIDNVVVSDIKTVSTVTDPKTQFSYYIYQGGQWNLVNASFYQLTDEDYANMGVATLSATTAPGYLPVLLKMKFPFAQEGATKVVVYKTSATKNTADEYIYKSGVWSPISLIETRTEQFVFAGWENGGWIFDPTLRVTMKKGTNPTDDYMLVVNYVKDNYGTETPSLLGYYGTSLQSEYYYGFAAYYGNISWRESDRAKDPTYAALTTAEEKQNYLDERTKEGLAVYLSLKFPDAQPKVSGVDLYCYVTTAIYNGVTTTNYVYKYQRVDGEPFGWKYIESNPL